MVHARAGLVAILARSIPVLHALLRLAAQREHHAIVRPRRQPGRCELGYSARFEAELGQALLHLEVRAGLPHGHLSGPLVSGVAANLGGKPDTVAGVAKNTRHAIVPRQSQRLEEVVRVLDTSEELQLGLVVAKAIHPATAAEVEVRCGRAHVPFARNDHAPVAQPRCQLRAREGAKAPAVAVNVPLGLPEPRVDARVDTPHAAPVGARGVVFERSGVPLAETLDLIFDIVHGVRGREFGCVSAARGVFQVTQQPHVGHAVLQAALHLVPHAVDGPALRLRLRRRLQPLALPRPAALQHDLILHCAAYGRRHAHHLDEP
mmetsp:Transcript_9613/g.39524  ORF Transcript_9613/g.39524 Transcript_9613/m.39524 type:complete len:319 (+) Transcript_9613:503-1459(+)